MKNDRAKALTQTVTEAVLAVPGVACLRPGLRGLLLTAGTRPPSPRGPQDSNSAVRITCDSRGMVVGLRIDVVVRAHHQAARTARAVRVAAAEAAATTPEAVRVTVTGIM